MAYVIRVGAEAVFSGGEPEYALLPVALGEGLGIRGMAPFREGFLLIAGNAGSEGSKQNPVVRDYIEGRQSVLYYWDPEGGEAYVLGLFPRQGKGKEEGIVVISDEGDGLAEIVVVYDSMAGGGATRFVIDWVE